MAGFGGAVKLTGESEYRRALAQISQSLREISSEMKTTNAIYDKNDQSTEALSARARDLNNLLNAQRDRLATLQAQYASLYPRVMEQAQAHQALVQEYNTEKDKLDEIGRTLGTSSQEYKNQQDKVLDLANEVKKSSDANDANQKSLSNLRVEMNNAQTDIAGTAKQMQNLGEETEKSGKEAEKSANGGYTIFKNVLANLATKVITSAIDGLKKLGQQFINIGKQAIAGYGQYEQMVGGIERMFTSAEYGAEGVEIMLENASNAFKTAGMSANDYMETATSFSSALIQGLGGDTVRAAQMTDIAMQDMADNVNAFGTSMESVRSAYAGFAKDNYTMLDNLKLGYGGNATEMARLINESGVLGDKIKVNAKTVKDVPFDKIVEAIHKVQQQIHVTGTTAEEGANTIQGSTRAMQASWQNLLVGIADDNADFGRLVEDFLSTLITPDGKGGVINQFKDRIKSVIDGISKMIREMLPVLIQMIVPIINENLPIILQAVQGALTAIIDTLPMLTNTIIALIPQLIQTLLADLPQIVQAGIDMTLALIDGIVDALPQLIAMLPQIINTIVNTLLTQENLQKLVKAGFELIGSLIVGIFQAFVGIGQAIYNLGERIHNAFQPIKDWSKSAGESLVQGIWSGLSSAYTWLTNKIRGWVGNVTSFIKRLFGIHSPSTLFRDEIGENLALGLGEGFMDEMGAVSKEMADAIPTSFDVATSVNGARYANTSQLDMVSAFKEALAQMKIELDDEVAGRFVERTVANAIYA